MSDKKNEAKVVSSGIVDDDPQAKAGHRGFQSKEAMQAAVKPRVGPSDEDSDAEPPTAEVADYTEQRKPQPARSVEEDPMRMVRVRSREFIPPFFYGKKQYSLPAGKDVLLPLAVKRHLEEKNLL